MALPLNTAIFGLNFINFSLRILAPSAISALLKSERPRVVLKSGRSAFLNFENTTPENVLQIGPSFDPTSSLDKEESLA